MNKKFLIIRPKYGLCNQLLAISKGIIFGLVSKRDVIFHSFQLDFRNTENICDFHDIIDMGHLQEIIKKYDIKIYSNKECNGTKLITHESNISMIKDFTTLLLNDINK